MRLRRRPRRPRLPHRHLPAGLAAVSSRPEPPIDPIWAGGHQGEALLDSRLAPMTEDTAIFIDRHGMGVRTLVFGSKTEDRQPVPRFWPKN
ncbi:MAG: hypothetical protein MUC88_08860 [Planctomycetes bacterium]|nr:hypothetical protein [Planctomycetota bacterium]